MKPRLRAFAVFFASVAMVAAVPSPAASVVVKSALDPTFGSRSVVKAALRPDGSGANAVAVQPDGRIVAAGFAVEGDRPVIAVARFLLDGGVDASFGDEGVVTTSLSAQADEAFAVAVQSDGKIVVAGVTTGATDDVVLLRYLSDGSLDPEFGTDGVVVTPVLSSRDDYATGLAIAPDGKIVVGGSTMSSSTSSTFAARYTTAGVLDGTFGTGGIATRRVGSVASFGNDLAVQTDGAVVVAGSTYVADATPHVDLAVVRFTSSGALDTTFNGSGIVVTRLTVRDDEATDVSIQADGGIVVGAYRANSSWISGHVLRYTPGGAADQTFGGNGIVEVPWLIHGQSDLVVDTQPLAGGRIVVGGLAADADLDLALARLNHDGTLDRRFEHDGQVITDLGADELFGGLAVQPDGRIVVAGTRFTEADAKLLLVRYEDAHRVRPDVWVGVPGTKRFIGRDVYERRGKTQRVSLEIPFEGRASLPLVFENDGNVYDRMQIRRCSKLPGFSLYVNVNGSYDSTGVLRPGERVSGMLKIRAYSNTRVGAERTCEVSAVSWAGDARTRDTFVVHMLVVRR